MAYVKTINGKVDTYPYSIGQLRRDNPNTSFPRQVSTEILESYGIYPVESTDQPTYDQRTETIQQNTTPELVDGTWTLGWTKNDKTSEEIQEYDNMIAANVRNQRNALLMATDYLALADNTLTPEMSTYRQALRDITTQEGFPHNVTWPTKPE